MKVFLVGTIGVIDQVIWADGQVITANLYNLYVRESCKTP
jgi:hypothetical protein